MIFCARATRGLRRMGRAAWLSSCSRNAHDRNVLVRRAQLETKQTALYREKDRLGKPVQSSTRRGRTVKQCSLDARSWGFNQATPREEMK